MVYINKLFKNFLIFFLTGFMSLAHAFNAQSPVGYWKTIDDITGQPKSIVQVYANGDQTLNGRVVKLLASGEDPNKLCTACTGTRHNQKIVGMIVMEGMKANGNKWDSGHILDPKNGKTYRCTLRLINNGSDMQVRGYIGISLFGRTQTWIRVNK